MHLYITPPREQCEVSHNEVLDFRRTLQSTQLTMSCYFNILLNYISAIIVISYYLLMST